MAAQQEDAESRPKVADAPTATGIYQDHSLTPSEVANDIYDNVLVERTRTPMHIPPDENGVHWWPAHERPIPSE